MRCRARLELAAPAINLRIRACPRSRARHGYGSNESLRVPTRGSPDDGRSSDERSSSAPHYRGKPKRFGADLGEKHCPGGIPSLSQHYRDSQRRAA